jgi:4-amino-4-deoxy-L-arabinose transferase-like glycosyltransferase
VAVVAAVPMHVAMTAAINNDALAEVVLTGSLLLMVRGVRRGFDRRLSLALGVVLGLALLTKVTIYAALPLALLALWGRGVLARTRELSGARNAASSTVIVAARAEGTASVSLRRQAAVVFGVAMAVSGWWFVRNAATYGLNDPFGLVRHDAVVVGQPRTQYTLAALEYFLGTTFQSFWGQFGWMGIVVDRRIYLAAGALSAVAVAGLIVFVWRLARRRDRLEQEERWALLLLGCCCLFVVGALLYYNLTFIQAQGRYLFPAIAAIGLFVALGLMQFLPRVLAPLGVTAVYGGLLVLDYLCLVRFVAPFFGTL